MSFIDTKYFLENRHRRQIFCKRLQKYSTLNLAKLAIAPNFNRGDDNLARSSNIDKNMNTGNDGSVPGDPCLFTTGNRRGLFICRNWNDRCCVGSSHRRRCSDNGVGENEKFQQV